MKPLMIGLLLASQISGPVDLNLERELALGNVLPKSMLVRIQAKYPDGSGVNKGMISCLGEWFAHADEDLPPIYEAPWFQTDSRGAVMFLVKNSPIEEFDCQAKDKYGGVGSTQFTVYGFGNHLREITIR